MVNNATFVLGHSAFKTWIRHKTDGGTLLVSPLRNVAVLCDEENGTVVEADVPTAQWGGLGK